MLMLIKNKDAKAWAKFKQEFSEIDDDDTYEFFQQLVAFYKGEAYEDKRSKLQDLKPTQPIVKDKEKAEKAEVEQEKAPKKKTAKKSPTKKKAAKKKVAKKSSTKKKAAKKKTAKKKSAKKKTTKKASK